MSKKVTFRTVIEVIGKPKEHVEEALKRYIEKIKNDEKYQILREEYAEVKQQENSFWGTFAELEIEAKDVQDLIGFCFDYMPSVIEILEPSKIELKDREFSDFFNDLQAKLHQVDMIAKQVKLENEHFSANMAKLLRNYLVVLLGERDRTLEQLSKFTGMKEEIMGDFLDKLIDEGLIKMEKGIYHINREKLD